MTTTEAATTSVIILRISVLDDQCFPMDHCDDDNGDDDDEAEEEDYDTASWPQHHRHHRHHRPQYLSSLVIADCIAPYLKRSTWNRLSVTSLDLLHVLQMRLAPWPSSSNNGNTNGDVILTTEGNAGILSLAISPKALGGRM
jgi:hypothetical protein